MHGKNEINDAEQCHAALRLLGVSIAHLSNERVNGKNDKETFNNYTCI